MDGVTVIRAFRKLRTGRYGIFNRQSDTTDTTRLVTPAPQRALPPPPKKNGRCFNAFLILFSYTVGIGSLILGGTYINDCPDQKMLPIGLIIFGAILVVSRLLNCVYDCRSMFDEDDLEDTPPCIQALSVIFFFASLGMFMAVCLWTISLDPTTKPEDRGLKNYCDSSLAHAASWVCIVGIVFFVMPVFSGCCGGIFSACCSS